MANARSMPGAMQGARHGVADGATRATAIEEPGAVEHNASHAPPGPAAARASPALLDSRSRRRSGRHSLHDAGAALGDRRPAVHGLADQLLRPRHDLVRTPADLRGAPPRAGVQGPPAVRVLLVLRPDADPDGHPRRPCESALALRRLVHVVVGGAG